MKLPNLGIRNRMLLLGILPAALIFTVIHITNSESVENALLEFAEEILRERTAVIATEIDRGTLQAVTASRTMAMAAENGLFGEREESMAFAKSILEQNPQFTAAYFGYEPNADGQDSQRLLAHDTERGSWERRPILALLLSVNLQMTPR